MVGLGKDRLSWIGLSMNIMDSTVDSAGLNFIMSCARVTTLGWMRPRVEMRDALLGH